MKKLWIELATLLMLALVVGSFGCAGGVTTTPTTTLTPTPTTMPTPTLTTTLRPTPTATPIPSPAALSLTVTEPHDESVVDTPNITVSGKTTPGAVVSVSVNDNVDMANVGSEGDFSLAVTLEEGPNSIEIIASDQTGNEMSSMLSVVYIP